MSPQMVAILHRISLLYEPDPELVFRQIVDLVSELYGNTMVMVNVIEGEMIRYRAVANLHPVFATVRALKRKATLCEIALQTAEPLLVQNAQTSALFCHHRVVDLKLRRYLGVPVCSSSGSMVGTLCLLDDQTNDILTDEDIQFFSLLAMRVSAELERERIMEERIAEQRAYAERLEERLTQQAAALKVAQEKLVEAAQLWAVGTVAVGVAHDLRNVLAAIQLELRALGEGAYPESIARQWDRLYVLTHSLLSLSDETAVIASAVSLSDVVDFVFRLIQGQAEVDGVQLEKLLQGEIPAVLGNQRRLEHLFVNLMVNALDAMTATGGKLTITLRTETRDQRGVLVTVQDTGQSIAPETLPHLFEPFFTTRANRTGLGLFSAQRIVAAHQGEIQVESLPDYGTSVSVWLPVEKK
ncbi:ATP-binding protein [Armatimonas sp.]|uniref:ATP-binding protein n=1 Tax=Armatimonas sp. TaxID=1872638 RepID=UPI00286BC6B3|nr:ATP-binding protein [Armatimonas sp.]